MRHVLTIVATVAATGLAAMPLTVAQTAPPTPTASQVQTAPQAPPAPESTREDAFRALDWDRTHAGRPLNLDGYKLTFDDNFDTLSVTREGGKGPWLAPVRSGFGGAKFLPPDPGGPFSIAEGILTIRAEKVDGKWQSGLMQTVDSKGQGFVQQYGYFEMRAQFPASKGAWPAFWLLSQNGHTDTTKTRTEIDIVEWYGGDPKGHHASVHLWPARNRQPVRSPSMCTNPIMATSNAGMNASSSSRSR